MRIASAFFVTAMLLSALPACRSDVTESTPETTTTTSTTIATGGAGGSGGAMATGGAGGTTTTTPIDKAKDCTDTFGDALTSAFGRLDGTVLAVVKPTDQQCPQPNSDHVVLEVVMNGAAYRMVVNVQSTFGDPNVLYLALPHDLPGPAWSEGWHTGLALDYVADFGVKSTDFAPHPLAEMSDIIADEITLGQKVSVYAESSGGSSAHKVHRNDGKIDGAIVLDADGPTPKAMLFHFADQTF